MFIGHFAVALGAKRLAPTISLGTLFLAAQLADLAWPVLVLAGLERVEVSPGATAVTPLEFVHYPWSHSLATLCAGGLVLAAAWRSRRGTGASGARTGAMVLAGLVVSHWVLDFVTHVPDLPLVPGGSLRLGLGLWRSVAATLAVELVLFAAGAVLYLRATAARDRTGRLALLALLAFLVLVHLGNVFGPPPPSATAVAGAGLAMWLLVAWGAWADRHRRAAAAPTG